MLRAVVSTAAASRHAATAPARRGFSAAAKIPTREDRFLFDLNGFLVVRGAVSPDEVAALNAAIDDEAPAAAVAREAAALKNSLKDSGMDANNSRTDLGGMLAWEGNHGAAFRSLLCHPKISPYLNDFLGAGYRLDHQPLCLLQEKDSEGFHLHGGPTTDKGGMNPELLYTSDRSGAIWTSLVGMSVALVDQGPGDGGFCVLPGSHKSQLPLPSDLRHGNSAAFREHIHVPQTKAGDVILFSEATIHGALPWRADRQRRLALFRFAPANMGYGRAYLERFGIPDDVWRDEVTEDQRAVLAAPYGNRLDRVVPGKALEERAAAKREHDLRIFGTQYF